MQSSPWQRDHSWKQTCPCRLMSTEMNFYYWKPKSKRSGRKSKKRRTPHSCFPEFDNNNTNHDEIIGSIRKKCGKKSLMAIVQTLIDKNFQTR